MADPSLSKGGNEGFEEDVLDPRIQVELEQLNKASDEINKLEVELDEARACFRQVLTDSTQRLNALAKRLGSCIEKARPYYDARMKAKEAHIETQNAALRFERACSQQAAAKEMVYLAEQGFFKKGQPFDPAWQEMLNHATMRVNDAEKERMESEVEHRGTAMIFNDADQRVKYLQKDLKRNIAKSRPYFEMKARFNQAMEEQKRRVGKLEDDVSTAKDMYAKALQSLESISDEIHQQRADSKMRKEMGTRGAGVGAEAPPPAEHSHPLANAAVPCCVAQNITSSTSLKLAISRSTESPEKTSQNPKSSTVVKDPTENKALRPCTISTTSSPHGSLKRKHSPAVLENRKYCELHPEGKNVNSSQDKTLTKDLITNTQVNDITYGKNNGHTENKCELHANEDSHVIQESQNEADIPPMGESQSQDSIRDSGLPSQSTSSPETNDSSFNKESNIAVEIQSPMEEQSSSAQGLSPSPDADSESTKANAEIMETLQKAKGLGLIFLRPNKSSEKLLDEAGSDTESITESMASVSMLDDDTIESLMLETGEFVNYLSKHQDPHMDKKSKRMSLPAKLVYLEDYMKFKPDWVSHPEEGKNADSHPSSRSSSPDVDTVNNEIEAN